MLFLPSTAIGVVQPASPEKLETNLAKLGMRDQCCFQSRAYEMIQTCLNSLLQQKSVFLVTVVFVTTRGLEEQCSS